MRLRLLVEIRAAALADIHTRERQETRWRQNIHTGAAVCPAFIRKHWEVCCMKIMDKATFEEQNVFWPGRSPTTLLPGTLPAGPISIP